MCVVDIDTGPALRLPLSVGPATHYQPLTGQATPSATHFRFPQTHKVRFPARCWNSDLSGGRNLDFSGRNFGFAATSWGRLIRQQSVRRKPRGAAERGGEREKSARLMMSRDDFLPR